LWATISTGVGPISQSALISGWDFSLRTGPEPSVDDGWLQISAIASVKVAFASASPDVLDAIFHSIETLFFNQILYEDNNFMM
jgi:hypothetical protein